MKLTVKAAALVAAVDHAGRSADTRARIAVLATVLLRADCNSVEIIGHNLDRCHAATCAASVIEPGAATVSAERLAGVLSAMPESIDVTLATTDTVSVRRTVTVSTRDASGRGFSEAVGAVQQRRQLHTQPS
jgi:DNA polymerase III sliding clamp (beta) subunit (PCNA family)